MISKYFTEEEFFHSNTALRLGINNTWEDEKHEENAEELCIKFLDPLRDFLKKPIIITSGYRNRVLNAKVGGAKNSKHLTGEAVDMKVEGMTPEELIEKIIEAYKKKIIPKFDKVIDEYRSWVHFQTSENPRGQVLKTITYNNFVLTQIIN